MNNANTIKEVLLERETLLKDDHTDTGGVSFHGETLGDFLDGAGICITTISDDEIMEILSDCGCTI